MYILTDCHGTQQGSTLEGHTHIFPEFMHLHGRQPGNIIAQQMNTAAGGLVQSQQVTQQGTFSGTTATHDDHDFTLVYLHIDTVQDLGIAVMGYQVPDLDC